MCQEALPHFICAFSALPQALAGHFFYRVSSAGRSVGPERSQNTSRLRCIGRVCK